MESKNDRADRQGQRNGVRPDKEIAEEKRNVLYMCISNRYIRKLSKSLQRLAGLQIFLRFCFL